MSLVTNVVTTTNIIDFCAGKNIAALPRVIKASENGLFASFISKDVHTTGEYKGKSICHNLWFAKSYSEKNELKAGDALTEDVLSGLVIIETTNEAGELRLKLCEPGNAEYASMSSDFAAKVAASKSAQKSGTIVLSATMLEALASL